MRGGGSSAAGAVITDCHFQQVIVSVAVMRGGGSSAAGVIQFRVVTKTKRSTGRNEGRRKFRRRGSKSNGAFGVRRHGAVMRGGGSSAAGAGVPDHSVINRRLSARRNEGRRKFRRRVPAFVSARQSAKLPCRNEGRRKFRRRGNRPSPRPEITCRNAVMRGGGSSAAGTMWQRLEVQPAM